MGSGRAAGGMRRIQKRLPVPRSAVRHPLRGPEPSVVQPCGDHRVGRRGPSVDPIRLNGLSGIAESEEAYCAASPVNKLALFENGMPRGTPETMLERTR